LHVSAERLGILADEVAQRELAMAAVDQHRGCRRGRPASSARARRAAPGEQHVVDEADTRRRVGVGRLRGDRRSPMSSR
jgi:hypothetical protein